MKYEEFREEFVKRLKERKEELGYETVRFYQDGFTSDDPKELKIIRNTNIKYSRTESDVLIGDFVILELYNTHRQTCRFSCGELYKEFEKNGWEIVWTNVNENLACCEQYAKLGIMEQIEENNYEVLKEKLFIRPLNFNDHRYELKDNMYRLIGDIVLVLYLLASDENVDGQHNVMSIKFPKSLTESWELSEEEIWEYAMTNTYMMAPPRMFINPLDTYNPPYHKGAFMALNSDIKSLNAGDIPTITTTKQMNGAIAMFYPGVQERIAELFGDDYYVAFTSIHDVKLHKKGTIPPIHILRSLKDTNNAFDPTETLSRKVYLYEQAVKELRQLEL